jgi:DNA-binding NarL/FixJ family response regulator
LDNFYFRARDGRGSQPRAIAAIATAPEASQRVKVLLADDHALMREALRQLLDCEPDIKVIAEVDNGIDAVKRAKEVKPDVIAMDISMPGSDGITATRSLLAQMPDARVLGLSAHSEWHFVSQMLAAGARGYVVKTSGIADMVAAVRAIAHGRTYLCAAAAAVMASRMGEKRNPRSVDRLGSRETRVLTLIAQGKTSQAIGDELHIARGTVDVHRRNIMRKLGLHSVPELTQYAIRHGLISL